MKNTYKKSIPLLLLFVLLLGLLVTSYLPQRASASLSGTSIEAVTLEEDATNNQAVWTVSTESAVTTISGSISDKTNTTKTGTLTINGNDSLGARVGDLVITYSYSLKGAKGMSGQGSASISSTESKIPNLSVTGQSTRDNTSDTITGSFTIVNWSASSAFSITISAKGGYRNIFGSITHYESTADVTISLAFNEYTQDSIMLEPAETDYTVTYYSDASATTESAESVSKDVQDSLEFPSIALVTTKGITFTSSDSRYACCYVYAIKEANAEPEILYAAADGRYYPQNGWILKPAFVYDDNGVAPFSVDSVSYWTWETAFTAAVTSNSKTVILTDNYTLPSPSDTDNEAYARNALLEDGVYVDFEDDTGILTDITYKIPAGVTLHIPRDAEYTGLTSLTQDGTTYLVPQYATVNAYVTPSVYEKGTLTINANTTLESAGTIIVNCQQYATSGSNPGMPSGKYGRIKLSDESSKLKITGGTLYCYGFIIGEGIVEVSSGAAVYEMFQVHDWRGFKATLSWMGIDLDTSNLSLDAITSILRPLLSQDEVVKAQKHNRSFVFSQYYVQNIETRLKFHVGANLNVTFSLEADEEYFQYILPFIGDSNNGLLKLSGSSGYFIRKYNTESDRTTYSMYCNVGVGSIKITVTKKISILTLNPEIDSQYNIFPLNSNLSIVMKSGNTLTVGVDVKLLPEASITIEDGANLVLSGGTEMFIYDYVDWNAGGYTYQADIHQVAYVASRDESTNGQSKGPAGRTIDESAKLKIDGTLTINEGAWIFTTAGYTRNGATTVVEDAKSADKVITGGGKIINNYRAPTDEDKTGDHAVGTLDEFEFRGNTGYTDAHRINTVPFVGKLAGITTAESVHDSFSGGTYYGLGADHENYWYTESETVAPTCTTSGYTHYTCSDYTNPYVADETSALGHDWKYDAGKCGRESCGIPMITFDAFSLDIASEVVLNLKFYIHEDVTDEIQVSVVEDYNTVAAEGSTLGEGNVWSKKLTEAKDVKKTNLYTDEGRYVVSQGIAAGEMTGKVTVTFQRIDVTGDIPIYDESSSEENRMVASLQRTAQDFFALAFADAANKKDLAEMCEKAAIFGGYAQEFFKIEGDPAYNMVGIDGEKINAKLDSATIDDALSAYTIATDGASLGITATSQRLNLDSEIFMRTYFTVTDNIEKYTFTLTYPTEYGKETATQELEPTQDGSRYYVDIPQIAVAYWDYPYKITVSKTGSAETYTVESSILSWANRCIKLSQNDAEVNMARAMLAYNQAAKTYFGVEYPKEST